MLASLAALVLGAGPPLPPSFWDMKESVAALAWSADGKTLLTAGGNLATGHVAFWDIATMTRTRRIGGTGMVTALALSPDGKTLVVRSLEHLGGRMTLGKSALFDVPSGKERPAPARGKFHTPTGHPVFSRDGKLLAMGHEGGVTIHDPATGKITATLEGEEFKSIWGIVFSPDGKTVAACGDFHGIRRWDARTGKPLASFEAGRWKTVSLAYSPDGKTLLVGTGREYDDPGEVVKLDVATGKVLSRWKGHAGPVMSVAFSADGKLAASGARSSDIRVWDAATGKSLLELSGPLNLTEAAFAPDGKTLAVSGGTGDFLIDLGGVRLWDIPSGRERLHPVAEAARTWREAMIRATEAEQAEARKRRKTDALDRARRAEHALALRTINEHLDHWDFAQAEALLNETPADLRWLAWHLARARLPRQTDLGRIERAAFSLDGTRLALSDDKGIRTLDPSTGKERFRAVGFKLGPGQMVFSPEGALLAVADYSANGGDSDLKVFDAAGKLKATLTGQGNGVEDLAFSPDGRLLASCGRGNRVIAWDTATWKKVLEWTDFDWIVSRIAFSPDRKKLAVFATIRTLQVREVATGKKLFEKDEGWGEDGLRFLGNDLVASRGNGATVLDPSTGRILRRMKGSLGSDDVLLPGERVLSRRWLLDLRTGEELARHEPTEGDRKREWIAAGFSNGRVMLVHQDRDSARLESFPLDTEGRRFRFVADGCWGMGFSADGSRLLGATAVSSWWPLEHGWLHTGSISLLERRDASTGAPLGMPTLARGAPLPDLAASRSYWRGRKVLALSPDGRTVATLEEEERIVFRDAGMGRPLSALPGKFHYDSAAMFAGGGLLTWGKGDLILWEAGKERKRWRLPGTLCDLRLVGGVPERALLATDAGAALLDLRTGEQTPLRGDSGYAEAGRFTADGRTAATFAGGVVRLWDGVSGHPQGKLRGRVKGVMPLLAIRPDGKALALAGSDGAGLIWPGE